MVALGLEYACFAQYSFIWPYFSLHLPVTYASNSSVDHIQLLPAFYLFSTVNVHIHMKMHR